MVGGAVVEELLLRHHTVTVTVHPREDLAGDGGIKYNKNSGGSVSLNDSLLAGKVNSSFEISPSGTTRADAMAYSDRCSLSRQLKTDCQNNWKQLQTVNRQLQRVADMFVLDSPP